MYNYYVLRIYPILILAKNRAHTVGGTATSMRIFTVYLIHEYICTYSGGEINQ